jgi:hypothetical protein
MKSTLLFLSVFLSANLFGQNVNIPDTNFKNYLVNNIAINTNSDSEIQVSEANAFAGAIDCSSQNILDLTGIEAFTVLTELKCFNNQLASLDVSSNNALTFLHCQGNQLISLDLSSNIVLETIYCGLNQLAYLDLPNSSTLTFLDCFGNQLTSLDVYQNTALGMMGCGANQLTSLNLSNNTYLSVLNCDNNLLECLNVKNGNNQYFINLYASGNPNLTCIEVDDVNYSTNNWTNIDPQTSFSTDCNNNGCSCTPTSSTDTQSACDSYTWVDGNTYITSNNSATYTTSNAAGCDSTITLNLTISPTPDNSITQNGGSLTATQTGATYQWIDCDNFFVPVIGEVNQTFFPSLSGYYAVEVTIGDCSSTSECRLVEFTGIDEIESLISVHPNPTKDEVTLSIGTELLGTGFVVTDNAGRIILTDTFKSTKQTVNLSGFNNGVYFITTDKESPVKIIKQ